MTHTHTDTGVQSGITQVQQLYRFSFCRSHGYCEHCSSTAATAANAAQAITQAGVAMVDSDNNNAFQLMVS